MANAVCLANQIYLPNNILYPGDAKRLVSYKLKDQCANSGDSGGGISSVCECPTMGLMISGVYYSLSGLGSGSGTYVTPISVNGGTLGINNSGGTITFVVIP